MEILYLPMIVSVLNAILNYTQTSLITRLTTHNQGVTGSSPVGPTDTRRIVRRVSFVCG